jgi:hypothetical protein
MKLEQMLETDGWSKSSLYSDESEYPWYVYRHICEPTGKCYVGYSDKPIRRWLEHVRNSRNQNSDCYDTKLSRAIRKYGETQWSHEIVAKTDCQESAATLELKYVSVFNSYEDGYNSTLGGDGASQKERLTEEFILDRIRDHKKLTGKFPTTSSLSVAGGYEGDTWNGYSLALSQGFRGLPGGSSLAKLLAKHFDHATNMTKVDLTEEFILERATEHFRIFSRWPRGSDGDVIGGHPGDTWSGYHSALSKGHRGLRGGTSLGEFLLSKTGYRNHKNKQKLTESFIAEAATKYKDKNGRWPTSKSGDVEFGHPGDTWIGYDGALEKGLRGLPGGSSLARLLDEQTDYVNHKTKPDLTEEFILNRAAEYLSETGKLPTKHSGSVRNGHPGDTWCGYAASLERGTRGLPGKSTLPKLLKPLKLVKPTQT